MMSSHIGNILPSVPEYYTNKNIFLTGATGFVGKVLIEKLLRCCPQLKGIYCLIRPKKGQDGRARLNAMFEEKCYDQLRADQPSFMSKVHPVHGDVLEDGLGLSEKDLQTLKENIHIVIHSAATVKFNEHLRSAVRINVLAVRKMITLCRSIQHLEAFVHVSTAYSNCNHENIEEKIYPSYVQPQRIIDALDLLDDEMIDIFTPKILRGLPNTYTFTKKLAEIVLSEEAADLPVAIVRPSIVMASWQEPIPGWVDNFNGFSGLGVAYGKGFMQSLKANTSMEAGLVPVDYTSNVIIVTAWHIAHVKKPLEEKIPPPVFHITSGSTNPITWGKVESCVQVNYVKFPFDSVWRRPGKPFMTSNTILHNYWVLVGHMIPAYAMDIALEVFGQKPQMVRTFSKLHKSMETLQYFTENTWQWTHQNLDDLRMSLSTDDRKIFYFNADAINWDSYFKDICIGTKTFLLKEDLAGIATAKAHFRKLRNISYFLKSMLAVSLLHILVRKSPLARSSMYVVISLLFKLMQFIKKIGTF